MQNEERVTMIRRLISEASKEPPPELARHNSVAHLGVRYPIEGLHRRAMIKQIALAATRYHLQADIDVFVALAGCQTPAGLTTEYLRILTVWCETTMERMAVAGDCPYAPPAA